MFDRESRLILRNLQKRKNVSDYPAYSPARLSLLPAWGYVIVRRECPPGVSFESQANQMDSMRIWMQNLNPRCLTLMTLQGGVLRKLRLFLLLFTFTTPCFSQTPLDVQPVKQLKPTGVLSTCAYSPATKEAPFYGKLASSERTTGSFLKPYDIHHKKGNYVSWFGIVRGISPAQQGSDSYSLLLENKYFDGLTDCHIMLVSNSGSGDFLARLDGNPQSIPALALVRVYGKVLEEKNDVPVIAAEYIRVWPWFTFTLSDLGAEDHSNPRWTKFCTLCKGGRIYNPYPTREYYLGMLGDPKAFGLYLKDF